MFVSSIHQPRFLLQERTGQPPRTVIAAFRETVRRHEDRVALLVQRRGTWASWTWSAYHDEATRFANALLYFEVPSMQAVGIMGFNSPEWSIAALGTVMARCVTVGVYATNGAQSCRHIAQHSSMSVVVVETRAHAALYYHMQDELPHLRVIVVYGEEPAASTRCDRLGNSMRRVGCVSWRDFLSLGSAQPTPALEDRIAAQLPEHCCTLIYTSGTTGTAKGVMLRCACFWIFSDLDRLMAVTCLSLRVDACALRAVDLPVTITSLGRRRLCLLCSLRITTSGW